MNLRLLAAALIAAAFTAPAVADEPAATTGSPTAAQPANQPDPDRKICKLEKPIGSNIPARTCKTAAEWQADRERARELMTNLQDQNRAAGGH